MNHIFFIIHFKFFDGLKIQFHHNQCVIVLLDVWFDLFHLLWIFLHLWPCRNQHFQILVLQFYLHNFLFEFISNRDFFVFSFVYKADLFLDSCKYIDGWFTCWIILSDEHWFLGKWVWLDHWVIFLYCRLLLNCFRNSIKVTKIKFSIWMMIGSLRKSSMAKIWMLKIFFRITLIRTSTLFMEVKLIFLSIPIADFFS